jgi:hypothetical protein
MDSLLGRSSNSELDKLTKMESFADSWRADIRNTLGRFMNTDEGVFFQDWMEALIDSRTYQPGDQDLSIVAFGEGVRYLAMEILRMAQPPQGDE